MEEIKLMSEIYTLGSGDVTWRSIAQVPYRFYYHKKMVLVEGVLHAPYWHYQVLPAEFDRILCFDVKSEQFRLLPGPASPRYHKGSTPKYVFNLVELGGCLRCVDAFPDDLVIWMMTEYGVKESWTKKYVIPNQQQYVHMDGGVTYGWWPLTLMKRGELLVKVDEMSLRFYNPDRNIETDTQVRVRLNPPRCFSPHVASLLSPPNDTACSH
ncbi:F-box protein [Tripterygium wilfordii]|uniref:F-box protein n=2 Tax=Tripterygium wilfordii TaxID=458696 RepID=A0A7J7C2A9_TRIWF|nr:F-box protein [Tripterygium wilfordii]